MTEQSMTFIAANYNITVSNTALGLTDSPFTFTDAQIAAADVMIVQVEAEAIRRRVDATAPTTTVGLKLDSTQPYTVWRGNEIISAWQSIRDGANDATVSVELWRW